MIPAFGPDGNLPPGIHSATWLEFSRRFGTTPHRLALLRGLRLAMDDLAAAGCRMIYVDGSFVTSKDDPGDFDACWDRQGVTRRQLHLVLLTFDSQRQAQKARYEGELFPSDAVADLYGTRFIEFFQVDQDSSARKGIVAMDPRTTA